MKHLLKQNPLPVIFFTLFVDLIGVGILIPVIPQLIANPDSPYYLLPENWTLQQGYMLLGALTAIFPLFIFLAAPVVGQISDIVGRKKVLTWAIVGTAISYVLFAIGIITRNIPLLIVSRAFDGMTGGKIAVAQAAIADISTPENRAKNFGLIGAAFGIGFILGPYIGGKLSDPTVVPWFNAATPFWFAAILSALNGLSVLFFFPETLAKMNRHAKIAWDKSVRNIFSAFFMKDLRLLFLVVFLFNCGFTFFVTFFSVYLINRYGFTQGNIGDYFAYLGVLIAFTNIFVVRKLGNRFKDYQILKVSLIIAGLCVGLHLFPNHWVQLLLIAPGIAIPTGVTQSFITGLISRSSDHSIQGEILGINSSIMALSQTLPAILSGYIAANFTSETPIFIGSLIIIMAGIFFNLFYTKKHVVPVTQ